MLVNIKIFYWIFILDYYRFIRFNEKGTMLGRYKELNWKSLFS